MAASAPGLGAAWIPAKPGAGPLAALASLRPVAVDVRVQHADGRGAARTVTRRLVGDGVRIRRWRDGLAATLHRPPEGSATDAALLLDATGAPERAAVAALAAPLLASRGVLVVAVGPARGRGATADPLGAARERLAALAPEGAVLVLPALAPGEEDEGVPLPPGVGTRDPDDRAAAVRRAAAWDGVLARLGARPREPAR